MSGNDEEIRVALTADPSDLTEGFEQAAAVAEESQQRMADAATAAAAQMKEASAVVAESQGADASRIKAMVAASLAAAAANQQQEVSERALREAQGLRAEATESQLAAATALRSAQEAQMVPMEAYIGATAESTAETEANTEATTANAAAQAGLNEKIASGAAVREYSALVDEALRGRYSQMTGTVATLSNRLGFMSALFSPIGAGFAAAAGTAAIFIAALVKGTEEEDGFERAVLSANGALGVTADQLHDMAAANVSNTVSMGMSVEAITKVAQSGKFAGDQIQYIGEAAANMAAVTGESLGKAVSAFASLQDEPLKAAVKLNEQYHFLTSATYDQIAAFDKLGMKEEATRVAQDALAADMNQNARTMYDQESEIAKGWDSVKNAISGAWDALKMWAATTTYKDQIQDLDRAITELQARATGANTMTGQPTHLFDAQIAQLQAEKLALQNLMAEQQREATNQGGAAQQVDDHIADAQSEAKAQQHEAKLTEIHDAGVSERLAAGEREAKQATSDAIEVYKTQETQALAEVDAESNALQRKLTLGEITKAQELAGQRDLEDQKYQLAVTELQQEMALYPQESTAYNELLIAKEKLLLAHQQKVAEIETQMVLDQKLRYQAMLAPINSAITTSINGIIQGTTTGKQAMQRLGMSILDEFISTGVKMVTDWVATQAAQTTVSQAAAAKRAQVAAAAAAQDKAVTTAETSSNIASYAAVAGAAAASSVAAIPYYGWAMADETGQATYADVMAFQGLASAAGGWDRVPAETLTLLHPDEMVLSAPIATGARNMFKSAAEDQQGGSGAGRSGGDVHIHTMDANSFRDLLRRHPREFREGIAHAMKHS